MTTIVFDIETAPLPPEQIEAQMPVFDPDEVRLGNIKDVEKAAARIEEARAKHRQQFFDRAALDARTGKVVAIGYMSEGQLSYGIGPEVSLLNTFWDMVRTQSGSVHRLIGFNIKAFDLPFLCRRSWHHGIAFPIGLWDGRYWSKEVTDLRDWWQLGDRQAHGSLDSISRFLGHGEKLGNGKDFAALLEADKDQALAYLKQDLELTQAMAKRFGLL